MSLPLKQDTGRMRRSLVMSIITNQVTTRTLCVSFHVISTQVTPSPISIKFNESKAPIEKLDHAKFWFVFSDLWSLDIHEILDLKPRKKHLLSLFF